MGRAEVIFIAWGANKQLADAVADALRKQGYSPQVGGDLDLRAEDSFLGNQITKQISQAPRAIILAQWPAEGADRRRRNRPDIATVAAQFRPNLMYEFGYLTARLQPSCLHLFLIGIRRVDLPSDVLGIRAEEIPAQGIPEMAAEIVRRFEANVKYTSINPVNLFIDWSNWKHRIRRQITNQEAPEHWLGEALLHSIQPAFYMGELATINGYCKPTNGVVERPGLNAAKRILSQVVELIWVADSEDADHIRLADLRPVERALALELSGLPGGPSDNWFDAIRLDYLGLCQYSRVPSSCLVPGRP